MLLFEGVYQPIIKRQGTDKKDLLLSYTAMAAGAGFISQMISSLKHNQRGSRSTYFSLREEYLRTSDRKGLKYKTATAEQLARLRAELIADRKHMWKKKALAFAIMLVLLAAVSAVIYSVVLTIAQSSPPQHWP